MKNEGLNAVKKIRIYPMNAMQWLMYEDVRKRPVLTQYNMTVCVDVPRDKCSPNRMLKACQEILDKQRYLHIHLQKNADGELQVCEDETMPNTVHFREMTDAEWEQGKDSLIQPFDFMQPMFLSSPVKIKTQLLEGVYILNHRRFSYAAAFDQSLIQRRSAGSPIAGLRLFHSDYNYAHDCNADLILNMNDIGRINSWQVSVGGGYAYNWVPVKNLLVSVMGMPILTCYNHIKTYSYDSNYRQMALDDVVHSDDELPREDYRIMLMDTDSRTSRISLNVNSRASITYNWSRCYVSANGNFYHSRYSYKHNSGRQNDWSVNANVGVRF